MKQNVVVSSSGCITSLGFGVEHNLQEIRNLQQEIKQLSCLGGVNEIVGISSQQISAWWPEMNANTMSLQSSLCMAAILAAYYNSGLSTDSHVNRERISVYIGGGATNFDEKAVQLLLDIIRDDSGNVDMMLLGKSIHKIPPIDLIKALVTAPSHFTAKLCDLHGVSNTIDAGNASSLIALSKAYNQIKNGLADIAIVASAENVILPHYYFYLFDKKNAKSLLRQDSNTIHNFTGSLNGIAYSSAAACVILESEQHALKRNWKLGNYVKGVQMNTFPSSKGVGLNRAGFYHNMQATLFNSNSSTESVDLIFPSSPLLSMWGAEELSAVGELFGSSQYGLQTVKANIGYCGAASGLVDFVIADEILKQQRPLPFIVLNKGVKSTTLEWSDICLEKSYARCLVNSASQGGLYCSLLLERLTNNV